MSLSHVWAYTEGTPERPAAWRRHAVLRTTPRFVFVAPWCDGELPEDLPLYTRQTHGDGYRVSRADLSEGGDAWCEAAARVFCVEPTARRDA